MGYNIFSDFHHQDLYNSLSLLFEKRLGHTLYRGYGMDWWTEGFWKLNDLEATAKQYLELGSTPSDGTLPLNNDAGAVGNYRKVRDEHNNSYHKAITLDTFKEMKIDIVIASIPQHIEPFKKLAQMKGAKFIFQQGNMFNLNLHEIPNLMSSTIEFPVPPTCNAVFYHQEFNTDVFKPSFIKPVRQITSFINVYHENEGFTDYMMMKAMLPDWDFRSYGGQGQDGTIGTVNEMATIMQKSYLGFHSKKHGDGFGHILYNWFACGKPIITRISDYRGKLGEELLENDTTCFDIDLYNYDELCHIINNLSPEKYKYMTQEVYQRFLDTTNFNEEEIRIKEFLNNLNG